jgi:hypothetical protein
MFVTFIFHFVREGDVATPVIITPDLVAAVDAVDTKEKVDILGYRIFGGYYDGALVFRLVSRRKYRKELIYAEQFLNPDVAIVCFRKNKDSGEWELKWFSEKMEKRYNKEKALKERRKRKRHIKSKRRY